MYSFTGIRCSVWPEYAVWSRSRIGGWAITQSPMMRTTVTLERLEMKGYLSFSEQLQKSRRSVSNETQLKLSLACLPQGRSGEPLLSTREDPLGLSWAKPKGWVVLLHFISEDKCERRTSGLLAHWPSRLANRFFLWFYLIYSIILFRWLYFLPNSSISSRTVLYI